MAQEYKYKNKEHVLSDIGILGKAQLKNVRNSSVASDCCPVLAHQCLFTYWLVNILTLGCHEIFLICLYHEFLRATATNRD